MEFASLEFRVCEFEVWSLRVWSFNFSIFIYAVLGRFESWDVIHCGLDVHLSRTVLLNVLNECRDSLAVHRVDEVFVVEGTLRENALDNWRVVLHWTKVRH